jgi:hypothetical protein
MTHETGTLSICLPLVETVEGRVRVRAEGTGMGAAK